MALPIQIDYRARNLIVLSSANKNAGTFTLPTLVQNDNTPLAIALLDPNGSLLDPTYTKRSVTGYSVKTGLFLQSDGSQLAYQNTWTDDTQNNIKTGRLVANSANQTAALASAKIVDCYLEVEISDDGGVDFETVIPYLACQLKREYIATAGLSTPPSQTAVTVENFAGVLSLNVKNGFVLENAVAGKRLVYLDDNGQLQVAPISEP